MGFLEQMFLVGMGCAMRFQGQMLLQDLLSISIKRQHWINLLTVSQFCPSGLMSGF